MKTHAVALWTELLCLLAMSSPIGAFEGVVKVEHRGFRACYRVFNKNAEAIIVAESGGRVLAYRLDGKNVLYVNPDVSGRSLETEKKWFPADGGCFDIGPETGGIPSHWDMWLGRWEASVTGDREVTLDSPRDPKVGITQQRVFTLDKRSSHLRIRQTMKNVSEEATRYCFWGRSLAPSGGICFLPLNPKSKFARGWAKYPLKDENLSAPSDPRVSVRDGYLLIRPRGKGSKFGTDSSAGWMAYFREGLLFAKRYACFADGKYTDGAGFSAEIWIDPNVCELEPLSPEAALKPGESYRFDEHWWILPWGTGNPDRFDLAAAVRRVMEGTKPPP